ncbi:MAG: PorP/SprF family type IX secretion system membrane protein [Flavobacteriales bacterium]|jgi:type IX secretion system PorP/SprF family membrane protein|nr:PorP/SprF family type IX secretion system membrane protein [Flavobacteriales bacterium]
MLRFFYILIFFFTQVIYAQDPVFTQSFFIPESINTGFTGALESTKAGLIYRSQKNGLNFDIETQFAFVDKWYDDFNLGLGISILNQKESASGYNFTQLNLNYAYAVQLNEKWFFRPSISVGLGTKSFGFQNALFEDQIDISTGGINGSSIDPTLFNETLSFFDFSSSLLFNTERTWVGITFRHLNKPNISLTDQGNVSLDIFMSIHASWEIPINPYRNIYSIENSIYILGNYMNQGPYSRFDIGSQYVYDKFSLGVIAATNPQKIDPNSSVLSSINVFFGLKWNGFKFSYAYDFNVNKINYTGSAYEVLIIYDFENNNKRLQCPKFF